MKVAILRENHPHESRVAASPETVKKMRQRGLDVWIESGAGGSFFSDDSFREQEATVVADRRQILDNVGVLLKVRPLTSEELELMSPESVVIGLLEPYRTDFQPYIDRGLIAFALERLPRTTRAQSMDVLSSQANLAGYKAVIDAIALFDRTVPMMMTAAGTLPPAHCFIMGAGVAGLQAIATARRLGAVVSATDIRPATKEEVLSLGAKFVAVEDEEFQQAQTAAGYGKEMSQEYRKKQAELIAQTIKKQDIIITTALIPGKPAPRLIDKDMIQTMKPGSIIVDMAVEQGGNVEGSQPNQVTITDTQVKIIGFENLSGRIAAAASNLYAKNVWAFLSLLLDKETSDLTIPWQDDIVQATLLTHNHRLES